ncbi:hypothetical protein TNCV_245961 [Trichonephila clavipes]|nr:hypothetical protein TNCV_245961 [Trichonephila clavipes]
MFVGRGKAWLRVRWKGWSGIFVCFCPSQSQTCWGRGSSALLPRRRIVIAVQHAFRRHFNIPPRCHVPASKCDLMWNNAFRPTRNVSKVPKTIRTP